MDQFCGSKFWDLNVTWNTEHPNFTPCFQNTVLVYLPCAFLWVFTPLEISYVRNSRYKNIPWNCFNIYKIVLMVCLLGLSIADLTLTFVKKDMETVIHQVEYVTPTVLILTLILSITLVMLNRVAGISSSGHQFLFWLLLTVCGIPRMGSEIENIKGHQDGDELLMSILHIIYFVITAIVFILNLFADGRPTYTSYSNAQNACPEFTRSFFSRVTFSWFGQLAKLGFKRTLVFDDIWSLNGEDRASEVIPKFSACMERMKYDVSCNKRKGINVAPILWKCFKGPLLFGMFLKLLQLGVVFIPPKVLNYLIMYIEEDEYAWKGYLYVAIFFISGSLQTLFQHLYFHKMLLVQMRTTTSLTSEIYKKALKLSNTARKESTVGEIVNIMAVDVQNLSEISLYLALWWSAPIQIGLAVYFLYQILGYSVFAGLGALLIVLPINAVLTNKLANLQKEQMATKDQRIKIINEMLNGIKVLKLYAWELFFKDRVTEVRNEELNILKRSLYYRAGTSLVWACAPFLVSLVTFATFILSSDKNILDTKTAMVSLALFNLLRMPLSQVPFTLSGTITGYISLKRINKFLNSKELSFNDITHEHNEVYSLTMDRCDFIWDDEVIPTLQNITLNVPYGSLVGIIGVVGSGKTSLLSAFLGEMKKNCGFANVCGKIAYVSQQAWIKNDTLQNNIVFGKSFNHGFYNSIVNACALKPDLEILPAGDQTEIGEKGINLSGGQKQRISLARAVYNDCDIYFLDDPLSAVDTRVGKHIFEKVIGPSGVLRTKTRMFVTHNPAYLSQVDQVVIMKHGQVSETGTFVQLLKNSNSEFSQFLLQYLTGSSEEDKEILSIKMLVKDIIGNEEFSRRIRLNSETGSHISSEAQSEDGVPKKTNLGINKGTLIEDEGMEEGNIKWGVFVHYLKRVGLSFLVLTLLFDLIYEFVAVGSNVWLSKWSSDPNMTINGSVNVEKRNFYLGIYGAFGGVQAGLAFFNELFPVLGCLAVSRAMHLLLLQGMLRSPLSFFETTPVGRILQRFSKDTQVIDVELPQSILDCLYYLYEVLATVALITYSTPIFLSIVFPIAIIYLFIQRYYVTTSRQIQRLTSVTKSPIYAHFSESLTGTPVIRAYGLQNEYIRTLEERVEKNLMCFFSMIVANRWLAIRLEMIGNHLVFFAALFAVLAKDKVDPGLVGLSITYSLQITVVLNWFVRLSAQIESNVVSVERIKEYTENESEASWEDPINLNSSWPEDGYITFDQLSIKYKTVSEPVLHNLTFHIMAREKIGIVGRTGSGKSTLALALFRILEAHRGKILIDGLDISKIGLQALRSKLTIIPQDPVLFSGTMRMNLDPFDNYEDSEIWAVMSKIELPFDLHHIINEGGENISVGQRQLICMARALLRKTKILILDEATASVDLETEALIQKTINEKFSQCTVLTVAHRLNTVLNCDRIMVMSEGNILEFDSPATLLQNKNSAFYKMAKDARIVS